MEEHNIYYCPKCNIRKFIKPDEDFNGICKVCGKEMKIEATNVPVQTTGPWNLKNSSEMVAKAKERQNFRKDVEEAIKRENMRSQQQNIPHCPICGSAKLSKISTLNRAVSVSLFGIFSKKIGKQWHCNQCGTDF